MTTLWSDPSRVETVNSAACLKGELGQGGGAARLVQSAGLQVLNNLSSDFKIFGSKFKAIDGLFVTTVTWTMTRVRIKP